MSDAETERLLSIAVRRLAPSSSPAKDREYSSAKRACER
jgi:hypothetical protein